MRIAVGSDDGGGAPRAGASLTWWGHSTVVVDTASTRVVTDPVLARRLGHLHRAAPLPAGRAPLTPVDLVLVSHLHLDHLHLPSLRSVAAGARVVVPRGATAAVPGLTSLDVCEVEPGHQVEVGAIRVEVSAARHDGRRWPVGRFGPPAVGYRVSVDGWSWWYPGDTGASAGLGFSDPVDLAVVPIGGWGPSLGPDHLDPAQAAAAAASAGARWALPVHYGTYWPIGLRPVLPRRHRRLFVDPPRDFVRALAAGAPAVRPVVPAVGEVIRLDDADPHPGTSTL